MDSYRATFISCRSASWKDKLKLALLGLVAGAILVAAVVLSLGLALVLIPVGFVAYLFRRPLLRALFRQAQSGMARGGMGSRGPASDWSTANHSGDEPQRRADGPTGDGQPQNRPRTVTIDADYTVVDTHKPSRSED